MILRIFVPPPTSVVFGERVRSANYWLKYEIRLYKKKGEGEDPLSFEPRTLEFVIVLLHLYGTL